jgi:hypothetical protein
MSPKVAIHGVAVPPMSVHTPALQGGLDGFAPALTVMPSLKWSSTCAHVPLVNRSKLCDDANMNDGGELGGVDPTLPRTTSASPGGAEMLSRIA